MLVHCPKCKAEIRLVDYERDQKVIKYLCPSCEDIVRIDLTMDEVRSSSSSGSYRQIERRHTVLVADDNVELLEKSQRLLEDAGYSVLLAGDGQEALQLTRDEHPDLLVLDLLMPQMTGFDVLREIRKDERVKDTPVLAVSGVYKDVIMDFLQQLGAQGFLDKENLEDTLVFRVQSLLERPEPPA